MRVQFSQVFRTNPNGSVSPLVPVTVGGATMGPGVSLGNGVMVGGLDIMAIQGKDLEIEKTSTGVEIKGHY